MFATGWNGKALRNPAKHVDDPIPTMNSLLGVVLVRPIALRKVSRISCINTRPDNASATACLHMLCHWHRRELSRQPVECELFFILRPTALFIFSKSRCAQDA